MGSNLETQVQNTEQENRKKPSIVKTILASAGALVLSGMIMMGIWYYANRQQTGMERQRPGVMIREAEQSTNQQVSIETTRKSADASSHPNFQVPPDMIELDTLLIEQNKLTKYYSLRELRGATRTYTSSYSNRSWFSRVGDMKPDEASRRINEFIDYHTTDPNFMKMINASMKFGPKFYRAVETAFTQNNQTVLACLETALNADENGLKEEACRIISEATKETKDRKLLLALWAAKREAQYSSNNIKEAADLVRCRNNEDLTKYWIFGMILTDSGQSNLAADVYPAIYVATSIITGTEPLDGEKREAWYFLAVDLEKLYELTAEKGFRNAAKKIYQSLYDIASDPRDGTLDPLLRLSKLELEDKEYAASISTLEHALKVARNNKCYTQNIPRIEEEILRAKEKR